MHSHHRSFALLLILVLGLTACVPAITEFERTPAQTPSLVIENTATSFPPATSTPSAYLTVAPEELDGVQITLLNSWSGDIASAFGQLINDFNQVNEWGIFVDIESDLSYGLMLDDMEERIASDDLPNIVVAPAAQLTEWQSRTGLLIDLTGYMDLPGIGMDSSIVSDFYPVFQPLLTATEPRLGLPVLRSMGVLFYNRTWAQELGFSEPPNTLEQFREQVCAAATANMQNADRDDDGTGGWLINTEGLTALSWLQAFGFTGLDTTGSPDFTISPAVDAFSILRSLADEGCAWTGRISQPYDYFSTRRALIYSGTLEDLALQEYSSQWLGSTDTWEVIPYPARHGEHRVFVDGVDFGMFASTPQQQLAAWLFIRWMMEPEALARLSRADNLIPLRNAAAVRMVGLGEDIAQWQQSMEYLDLAVNTPQAAWWAIGRPVLADAFWQMFQANYTADQADQILSLLDSTIADIQAMRSE